jgi:hypothetical protein
MTLEVRLDLVAANSLGAGEHHGRRTRSTMMDDNPNGPLRRRFPTTSIQADA